MNTYLIIYSREDAKPIVDRIKTFREYVHVKNRVWCISTEIKTATEVRDRFKDISGIKELLVVDISHSAWAAINLSQDVVYWLKER